MSQDTVLAQAQRDTLRRLTDNSFFVPVSFEEANVDGQTSTRETIHVQCRELPLETLLFILADLMFRVGDHAMTKSGEILSNKLKQYADEKDARKQEALLAELIGSLVPTLLSMLPHTPELVARVLVDCVIGATPDDVRRLGVSPSMAILSGILTRLDSEEVRDQFKRFFATLWIKFRRK